MIIDELGDLPEILPAGQKRNIRYVIWSNDRLPIEDIQRAATKLTNHTEWFDDILYGQSLTQVIGDEKHTTPLVSVRVYILDPSAALSSVLEDSNRRYGIFNKPKMFKNTPSWQEMNRGKLSKKQRRKL